MRAGVRSEEANEERFGGGVAGRRTSLRGGVAKCGGSALTPSASESELCGALGGFMRGGARCGGIARARRWRARAKESATVERGDAPTRAGLAAWRGDFGGTAGGGGDTRGGGIGKSEIEKGVEAPEEMPEGGLSVTDEVGSRARGVTLSSRLLRELDALTYECEVEDADEMMTES